MLTQSQSSGNDSILTAMIELFLYWGCYCGCGDTVGDTTTAVQNTERRSNCLCGCTRATRCSFYCEDQQRNPEKISIVMAS